MTTSNDTTKHANPWVRSARAADIRSALCFAAFAVATILGSAFIVAVFAGAPK